MIPSLDEITRGLFGAFLIMRNDERGLLAFDNSFEGFIKSFFAEIIHLMG